MKRKFLLTKLVTGALPFAMLGAEGPAKSSPLAEGQIETSGVTNMRCMRGIDMAEILTLWKNQDAELQQLLTEMNQAPADKKADATAALISKLVQQQAAFHEKAQDLVNADAKDAKEMCCGMRETED
jgi:hypothetical protein